MAASIQVDASVSVGDCPHFWEAAGEDYAYDWTFTPAGEFLLDEIRRTKCIRWFRNHHALSWKFRLPGGKTVLTYTEDQQGRPVHDFSAIEAVYDRWLAAGIRPVVEMDYLPAALRGPGSGNHVLPKDWGRWRDLMRAFVRSLQARYGVEETRRWYFEAWNEPDWWPRDRLDEFFRLYDEFAAAVAEVDSQLRIGGPATYTEHMLEEFLRHATYGANSVTGGKGTRADFVSHHSYGVSGNTLPYHPALQPHPQDIALRVYWLYEAFSRYPGALQKEFHLNEWGLVSHFDKTVHKYPPLIIRNTEYSPLFMMKLVHLLFAVADNRGGFLPKMMLYWGGAYEAGVGLFAGNRALVTAREIAKPMLRGFQIMARMGDRRLACEGAPAGSAIGAIATHGEGAEGAGGPAIRILVYHFIEDPAADPAPCAVDLQFSGLSQDGPATAEVVRLDRSHANSYRAWEAMGSPKELDEGQLGSIRRFSELRTDETLAAEVRGGRASVRLSLPGQGAAMVILRPKAGAFAPPLKRVDAAASSSADVRPA